MFPITAYTDSVDATGDYFLDVCGEKTVTLDADTPTFLLVKEDPIYGGFFI